MITIKGNNVHLVFVTDVEINQSLKEDKPHYKDIFTKKSSYYRDNNFLNKCLKPYVEPFIQNGSMPVGVVASETGCILAALCDCNDSIDSNLLDVIKLFIFDNVTNSRDLIYNLNAVNTISSTIAAKFVTEVDWDYDWDYNLSHICNYDYTKFTQEQKVRIMFDYYIDIISGAILRNGTYDHSMHYDILKELLVSIENVNTDGYLFSYKDPCNMLDLLDSRITKFADVYPVDFKKEKLILVQYKNKSKALRLLEEFDFRKENYSVSFIKEHGKILSKYVNK